MRNRAGHAADWIELDGAVNVRAVVPGVLLRSDNLQDLSPRDIRVLVQDHSLEVVLDLRSNTEVELEGPAPFAPELGVRVEHRSLYPAIPSGAAPSRSPWGIEDEREAPDESPIIRAYLGYLRRRPDSVAAAIQAIARADGAALVQCAAGKDRTGVVVALALDAAGVDRERIVGDYLASRERLEAIVARLIVTTTYRDNLEGRDLGTLSPLPGTMERLLELLDERFGGSAAWLSAQGLDGADLALLRERLRP
jgi:hypothetical protein